MGYLILVRHGESRWNLDNKFTGWVDVPLSKKGIEEALANATELEGIKLDLAFTSLLSRAQETLLLILAKQDRTGIFLHENTKNTNHKWYQTKLNKNEIPIYSSIKLNERYYGKLQGINKKKAKKKFGEEQVLKWRRGYEDIPPGGESLKKVYQRTVPYFKKNIIPQLKQNKNIIISGHGNSLRTIIKYIENISSKNIVNLELANGKPTIYKYQNKKLVRQNIKLSYNRPIKWK